MELQQLAALTGISVLSFGLAYYGSAVGLILGHLRLPLLVLWTGSPAIGAATNLAISGLGAFAGATSHIRQGTVSWRILALMGIPSALGAFVAAQLFGGLAASWGHFVIGGGLIAMGVHLTRPERESPGTFTLPRGLYVAGEIAIGLGLGFVAGILGLMLGSLRLPTMIRVLRIPPAIAVGTNMAIGCLTALVGSVAAFMLHAPDPIALLVVGLPTIAGGYLGARLTSRWQATTLRAAVGWTVAASGLLMIVAALWRP
jgi:uncharacterized membrane protein YfcA